MFVLDATNSMGNSDSGCTVPGISSPNHPTRMQCALYSIQSMLKTMPKSLDKVGLMVFPGLQSQYSPTSHPCTTYPNSVPYYSSNIKYEIGTALDNTYNDGAGSLVTTSPMVQAVGWCVTTSPNGGSTGCAKVNGGQGSYAAEVLNKAQAALGVPATGSTNVIVFLSDGDYGASLTQLNNQSSKVANQCQQAVTAAQAITSYVATPTSTLAPSTIYSVAYGAATSGCGKDTGYSPLYNPCTTMKAIASDPTKFYSSDSNCVITGSANTVGQLPDLFSAITTNLTKPRLLSQ